MFDYDPTLNAAYDRRFRQYAAFLHSLGVAPEHFAVTPFDRHPIPTPLRIAYGPGRFDDGDTSAVTSVDDAGFRLRFTSGLSQALFHLSWYFDDDRGPRTLHRLGRALGLETAMDALGLTDKDVATDGDGRRTGLHIDRIRSSYHLSSIDTYGDRVSIATSGTAPPMAYLVCCIRNLERTNIVERTADLLP